MIARRITAALGAVALGIALLPVAAATAAPESDAGHVTTSAVDPNAVSYRGETCDDPTPSLVEGPWVRLSLCEAQEGGAMEPLSGETITIFGTDDNNVSNLVESGTVLTTVTTNDDGSFRFSIDQPDWDYVGGAWEGNTDVAFLVGSNPTQDPEPTPTEDPEPTPTEDPEPTPTEDPEPTPTEDPEPTPTEDPEPTPTENPEPTPTENPEPTPTENPEPTPTENPELPDRALAIDIVPADEECTNLEPMTPEEREEWRKEREKPSGNKYEAGKTYEFKVCNFYGETLPDARIRFFSGAAGSEDPAEDRTPAGSVMTDAEGKFSMTAPTEGVLYAVTDSGMWFAIGDLDDEPEKPGEPGEPGKPGEPSKPGKPGLPSTGV